MLNPIPWHDIMMCISYSLAVSVLELNEFQAIDVGGSKISSEQNHGYLLYRGDYTTQLYVDCNKPLKGGSLY